MKLRCPVGGTCYKLAVAVKLQKCIMPTVLFVLNFVVTFSQEFSVHAIKVGNVRRFYCEISRYIVGGGSKHDAYYYSCKNV